MPSMSESRPLDDLAAETVYAQYTWVRPCPAMFEVDLCAVRRELGHRGSRLSLLLPICCGKDRRRAEMVTK